MLKEFFQFLKEYNIVSLSMAFIMGAASNSLVKSLVDDLVMPFINPLIEGGEWQEAILKLGPIEIRYGSFLGELLHFVILALVVFFVAKKILKETQVTKK